MENNVVNSLCVISLSRKWTDNVENSTSWLSWMTVKTTSWTQSVWSAWITMETTLWTHQREQMSVLRWAKRRPCTLSHSPPSSISGLWNKATRVWLPIKQGDRCMVTCEARQHVHGHPWNKEAGAWLPVKQGSRCMVTCETRKQVHGHLWHKATGAWSPVKQGNRGMVTCETRQQVHGHLWNKATGAWSPVKQGNYVLPVPDKPDGICER